MKKTTNYQYRKVTVAPAIRPVFRADETVDEWKTRIKGLGLTQKQVDEIEKVTSLEAFVAYCREQDLAICDINAHRFREGTMDGELEAMS